MSMSATPETQFTLFDRPSSLDGYQAPRQRRRAHLPDLVQAVGKLKNEELIDLVRIAIGEARRRGISLVSTANDSSQETAPMVKQTPLAKTIRKAAPMPEIPPAKASMVR